MNQGRIQEKRSAPPPDMRDSEHNINYYSTIGPVTILRFIPLQTDLQSFGVLCLRMQHSAPYLLMCRAWRKTGPDQGLVMPSFGPTFSK